MSAQDAAIREEVQRALSTVLDPCSVAMGRPLDLVTMGLISDVVADGGRVKVKVLLTDPTCFAQAEIIKAVDEAVLGVRGVDDSTVEFDGDQLWTADRIGPAGRVASPRRAAQRTSVQH